MPFHVPEHCGVPGLAIPWSSSRISSKVIADKPEVQAQLGIEHGVEVLGGW